tara:strand:- start:21 stop:842 length:822 start_codon:yes stop_codon:yes gene_type:complete
MIFLTVTQKIIKDVIVNLQNLFFSYKDDFIFDLMSIENFNNNGARMRFWFEHARKNLDSIEGDIFEFGVFRGNSLLAMALLLKKLGSGKKVYAFDTFSGFPDYSALDNIEMFKSLFEDGIISKAHYEKHKILIKMKKIKESSGVSVSNISSSGDFSENSLLDLEKKIELLDLDNIVIVKGKFEDTVPAFFANTEHQIFSANIDCDLYDGYKTVLPYIWKNLSVGGYVHLDEYYSLKFPGARIACDEFFKEVGVAPVMNEVPDTEFERWYFTKH